MSMKKNIVILAVAALILSSCGTTVALMVKRTPTMDTTGIKRIAIMDIQPADGSSLQVEVAKNITQVITTKIQDIKVEDTNTSYFTLVSPTEIRNLQSKGESIENHVDALFIGQIITLNVNDSSKSVERINPQTKQKYSVTIYTREVELAFTYNFQRARDGSLVGAVTKRGRSSDSSESRDRLRTPSDLANRVVNNRLANLYQDVAPYTAKENRALMPEKSKDKVLKAKMADANKLIKEGSHKAALNVFLNTYDHYGNFAAAYNAAIMYEVLGDVPNAYALIQFEYDNSGNPRARDMMARLDKVMKDQELLATTYQKGAATQREKVTQLAVSEIKKVVPSGTKVWIFNNSQTERNLAAGVIDNVASELTKSGITLVDRENTRLMDMEQQFQMSGAVSDNDFVSIGNAAGASVLITIGVTGTSSARRLQVQVMDMEKRTYTFRSGSTDEWNI